MTTVRGNEDTENISLGFHSPLKENRVVTSQPESTVPLGDPGCDVLQTYDGIPGLQYLIAMDRLVVKKETDFSALGFGCVTKSNYSINNIYGMFKYSAVEDAVCCVRNCFGIARPFNVKILNYNESEVIRLHHKLRCDNYCFPCCLQHLEIYAPPGNLLGSVTEKWSIGRLNLSIQTSEGVKIFKVTGPACAINCGSDVEFQVYDENNENPIGNITKQWSDSARMCDDDCFKDADTFEIAFPPHLDPQKKALLLGALFLIIQKDSKSLTGQILFLSRLICEVTLGRGTFP